MGLFILIFAILWLTMIIASKPYTLTETQFYAEVYDHYEIKSFGKYSTYYAFYMKDGAKFTAQFAKPKAFLGEVKAGDPVTLRATSGHVIVTLTAKGHNYMSYADYYNARQKDRLWGSVLPVIIFLIGLIAVFVPPIAEKQPVMLLRPVDPGDKHPHRPVAIRNYDMEHAEPSPPFKEAWEQALRRGLNIYASPYADLDPQDMIVMIVRFLRNDPHIRLAQALQYGRAWGIPYQYYDFQNSGVYGRKLMLRFLYQIKTKKGIPPGSADGIYLQWSIENNLCSNEDLVLDEVFTQEEAAAMIFRCWPRETEI